MIVQNQVRSTIRGVPRNYVGSLHVSPALKLYRKVQTEKYSPASDRMIRVYIAGILSRRWYLGGVHPALHPEITMHSVDGRRMRHAGRSA
jgi:hypothetical protein